MAIRVNDILDNAGTGAPGFSQGLTVASTKLSQVEASQPTGYGSTGTQVRTFTSGNTTTVGSDITYASDTTNGDTFTINADGIYAIDYFNEQRSAGDSIAGISINASSNTTSIKSLAAGEVLGVSASARTASVGLECAISATVRLSSGDVIRAHTDGNQDTTAADCKFRITQLVRFT